jgi:hypothetical protein
VRKVILEDIGLFLIFYLSTLTTAIFLMVANEYDSRQFSKREKRK